MSTQELVWKLRGDPSQLKAVFADVRREVAATTQAQKVAGQGELSMRQQLAAAASLQRQRSAALIAQWKEQERQAKNLAAGVRPVSENLQKISDVMQTLRASTATLEGPLGGVAGRLGSLSTLAGQAESGMSGLVTSIGPVGIAVAGAVVQLAAMGLAAKGLVDVNVALVNSFFDLAKSAAEWRGQLFDTSQATGVSVETLSALEVLSRTTGGSLESLAASLGIFQKHLEEAKDSGSKAAKTFKELGVETFNTEDALRQTLLALSRMPEGFAQTAKSLELFGRGGKAFLAILKESHGDLDLTISKLREMGIVVSTEDAIAADKFNDELELLHLRFRALLGKEAIPGATQGLIALGRVLDENRDLVNALGGAVHLAGLALHGFVLTLNTGVLLAKQAISPLIAVAVAMERIARATGLIKPVDFGAVSGGLSGTGPAQVGADVSVGAGVLRRRGERGGVGSGSGPSPDKDQERAEKQRLDYYEKLQEDLKRVRDELHGVNVATKVYAVEQSILNGVLKDASPALQEMARTTAASVDKTETQLKLTKELRKFLEDQEKAIRLVIDGERGHLGQAQDLIKSIEAQGGVLQETTKFWLQFNAGILQANETAKRLKETLDSVAISVASLPEIQGLTDSIIGGVTAQGRAADEAAGEPPDLQPHIDQVGILRGAYEDLAKGIAQGIGSIIQNFVLMGSVGPQAFRKVLAAALATVAAQAGAQAIYELALGFAALTPWGAAVYGPAIMHFKAAALLGSIALVAGAAGRLTAGNAFQGAVGGGTGGESAAGSVSTKKPPSPADIDRRTGSAGFSGGVIEIRLRDDVGDFIEAKWIGKYHEGGRLRNTVLNDGQA